jgi:hypothetical protein
MSADSYEQDRPGGIVWIPAGRTFAFDDIVTFAGKGEVAFEEVAHRIDLILTGAHATGAIPRELEPFIEPAMTQRKQLDYSDLTTKAIARRWAGIDPHVVYIENPYPRLVFDQNRPPPPDPEATLREIFARVNRSEAGEKVSYAGLDAIRPVTFANERILQEPVDNDQWSRLVALLRELADRGSWHFSRIRDQVIETVFEHKCSYLHRLPIETLTAADLHSALNLHVQCVHDTMNTKALPNGAIDQPRESAADLLPGIVALSNRGDVVAGEPRPRDDGKPLDPADVPTIAPAALRAVRRAMQLAHGVSDADLEANIGLNRPYFGSYEIQALAPKLREMAVRSIVRHHGGARVLSLSLGTYQSEFLREYLLGPANTQAIKTPGNDWPEEQDEHIESVAAKLKTSYDLLRQWGFGMS